MFTVERKIDLNTIIVLIGLVLSGATGIYAGAYRLRAIEEQQVSLAVTNKELTAAMVALRGELVDLRLEVTSLRSYYQGRDNQRGRER